MKIVGVIRVLNESDIIEAVLRHHLAQIDQVVVLDDGSCDGTVEIIRKLIEEGLKIYLVEERCVFFSEVKKNTFLYNLARDRFGADWVMFFDSDEFLDVSQAGCTLRNYLAALPASVDGIHIRLANYIDSVYDNQSEIIVPKRMVWRHIEPHDVLKVILRAAAGVTIAAGNHGAQGAHGCLAISRSDQIVYGHYYRRSGWQELSKSLIGRLKVMAAGADEVRRGSSAHYCGNFNAIVDKPEKILKEKGFFFQLPDPRIMHVYPLPYEGGPLRYTATTDYKSKMIRVLLNYGFDLAKEFGAVMDLHPEIRDEIATPFETRSI
jgi:glycosyltransferase involved in cell wall biosynthesis